MTIINLTPHAITVVGNATFAPSGAVARCASITSAAGSFDEIPLTSVSYGDVESLPAPQKGVLYVVSALVRAAVPSRKDVASPGDLLRDDKGNVIGCKSLVVNS